VRHTSTLIALALLFSSPLEAAVLNIVAISASNTFGWGVGSQNAYPAQLQTILRKKGIQAPSPTPGFSAIQRPACSAASIARCPRAPILSSYNRAPMTSALGSQKSNVPPTSPKW